MFLYTISVAVAIFILIIVGFRLLIHFHFCRRISARYPGEKIKGCPLWTQANNRNGPGQRGSGRLPAGAGSLQHNISQMLPGDEGEEAKGEEKEQRSLSFQQQNEDYQAIPV